MNISCAVKEKSVRNANNISYEQFQQCFAEVETELWNKINRLYSLSFISSVAFLSLILFITLLSSILSPLRQRINLMYFVFVLLIVQFLN